jgi:hypothetical protein
MAERTEEQLDDLWEITSNLSLLLHELRERITKLEEQLGCLCEPLKVERSSS